MKTNRLKAILLAFLLVLAALASSACTLQDAQKILKDAPPYLQIP